MVQYIPRAETGFDRFTRAIGSAGQQLGQQFSERLNKAQEDEAILRETGIDLSGVHDQQSRQEAFKQAMAAQLEKRRIDTIPEDQRPYNVMKDRYGKEIADLYNSATEGGKTAILNNLLEREARGDFEQELDDRRQDYGIDIKPELPGQASAKTGSRRGAPKEEAPIKAIDYDKGLTPAERIKRQESRYSINLPLYQENQGKLQAAQADKDNLNILSQLSDQISGIHRLNIHPQTGELIVPALASPEAQRYVKTINDFTKNAKDSYGARVTNFDLTQFMKRLPTLANTKEARRQIIEQLQIINDINRARYEELDRVIDAHGGLRGIDYDKAQRMAEKNISKKLIHLRSKFSDINHKLDRQYKDNISSIKETLPRGQVLVRFNDGTVSRMDESRVKEFLNDEAGELL